MFSPRKDATIKRQKSVIQRLADEVSKQRDIAKSLRGSARNDMASVTRLMARESALMRKVKAYEVAIGVWKDGADTIDCAMKKAYQSSIE